MGSDWVTFVGVVGIGFGAALIVTRLGMEAIIAMMPERQRDP